MVEVHGCDHNIKAGINRKDHTCHRTWDVQIPPAYQKKQRTVIGKGFSKIFHFSNRDQHLLRTTGDIDAFCNQRNETAGNCERKFALVAWVVFTYDNHQKHKCNKNTKQVDYKPGISGHMYSPLNGNM